MRLSPKSKTYLLLVLCLFFLTILNLSPIQNEVKNFFYLISAPIQKKFWQAGQGLANFFETISEIKNLKKENEELKLRIKELLVENTGLKELKKENEMLREALGIGLEKEFRLALAQVVAKDLSQDFLLINKGSQDNISEDLTVISQQKFLIGKISQVYKNFSKVMLITNKDNVFDAKIGDSEISGLVKGKGNFKIFIDLVPQEKELKIGDLVVTSGLEAVFPHGLLVGEIQEIKKSDINPWQQAEIKPAFDIREISNVFIILK